MAAPSAADTPALARCLEPCLRSLADQLALELRQGPEDCVMAGPEWLRRYGPRAEQTRLPSSKKGRTGLARPVGADGFKVLDRIDAHSGVEHLRKLKAVQVLHRVWGAV